MYLIVDLDALRLKIRDAVFRFPVRPLCRSLIQFVRKTRSVIRFEKTSPRKNSSIPCQLEIGKVN